MGRVRELARAPGSCAESGEEQNLPVADRSRARVRAWGWVERSVPWMHSLSGFRALLRALAKVLERALGQVPERGPVLG